MRPQSHANSEYVRGLDIAKEVIEDDGDLVESLGVKASIELALDSRSHSLAHESKVTLLMKGNPSGQKRRFSCQIT